MSRRPFYSTSSDILSITTNSDPSLRELFEACKSGDLVKVKRLVTPQNVNARDTAGRKSTPLHFAAGNVDSSPREHVELLRFLKIFDTDTRVFRILGYGRRDVVEYLLSVGAQIQARDDGGLHPIHNACSFGHADVVRLLLEAGANPNVRDNWNFTPLHEAALKGKADVCIGEYRL